MRKSGVVSVPSRRAVYCFLVSQLRIYSSMMIRFGSFTKRALVWQTVLLFILFNLSDYLI